MNCNKKVIIKNIMNESEFQNTCFEVLKNKLPNELIYKIIKNVDKCKKCKLYPINLIKCKSCNKEYCEYCIKECFDCQENICKKCCTYKWNTYQRFTICKSCDTNPFCSECKYGPTFLTRCAECFKNTCYTCSKECCSDIVICDQCAMISNKMYWCQCHNNIICDECSYKCKYCLEHICGECYDTSSIYNDNCCYKCNEYE